jgi:hypothetical protein
MKTKFTLFRRGGVFYTQDSTTGKQASLRTKDETEAKSLHIARAYLTASDPAFVERTWQAAATKQQPALAA